MVVIHDPRCINYGAVGHLECPARISGTVARLQASRTLKLDWVSPTDATEKELLRAHGRKYLATLRHPAGDFDADTPTMPGLWAHAVRAAGAALTALALARQGKPAFSLMRPPGHHATAMQAMGYCYLNNAAIAALAALADGCRRVAVFDFDVHHGNGTEEILLGVPGTAVFSVHQAGSFPLQTGERHLPPNAFNYPVPPHSPRTAYLEALHQALNDLRAFRPDLLVISAGFDAYYGDPLADQQLQVEDYQWLGHTMRGLGLPAFSLLEGGYSPALPELIGAYLEGWSRKQSPGKPTWKTAPKAAVPSPLVKEAPKPPAGNS
jgi:acetoin utilization deacetylase AcuC-like enzyme